MSRISPRMMPRTRLTLIRDAMARAGLGVLLLACGISARLAAAETAGAKPPVSNRWLVVLETSRAMQSRAEAVQRITATLLLSGMNGQMRPGDTLGIWTYNRDLYAGQFPLQVWSPEANREIASRAFQFVRNQRYANEGSLDKVLPGMLKIITNSDFITIILISSGDAKIDGTPFDDRINSYYTTWQSEQQKDSVPFVTVLRAVRGQIKNYAVNTPPWPLEMPPASPELVAARVPPKPPPEPKPQPPVYAAPLIISGHKPEPETQSATVPAATNAGAPQPVVAPAARTVTAEPDRTPTTNPPQKELGAVNANGNIARQTTVGPATATPRNEPQQTPVASEDSRGPRPVTPSASAQPKTEVTGANSETPPAGTVATRNDSEAAAPAEIPSRQKPGSGEQTAIAETPNDFLTSRTAWIAGAALLAIGFAAVLLLARRSRSSAHASLISRSLDRDKK